jgi:hypothetical protein
MKKATNAPTDKMLKRTKLIRKAIEEYARRGIAMTVSKRDGFYRCVDQASGRETKALVYTLQDCTKWGMPGVLMAQLDKRHEKIIDPDTEYVFVFQGAVDEFYFRPSSVVAESITKHQAEYNEEHGKDPEHDNNDIRYFHITR